MDSTEQRIREIARDEIERNHRCWNCHKIMDKYDGFCCYECRKAFFNEVFAIEQKAMLNKFIGMINYEMSGATQEQEIPLLKLKEKLETQKAGTT